MRSGSRCPASPRLPASGCHRYAGTVSASIRRERRRDIAVPAFTSAAASLSFRRRNQVERADLVVFARRRPVREVLLPARMLGVSDGVSGRRPQPARGRSLGYSATPARTGTVAANRPRCSRPCQSSPSPGFLAGARAGPPGRTLVFRPADDDRRARRRDGAGGSASQFEFAIFPAPSSARMGHGTLRRRRSVEAQAYPRPRQRCRAPVTRKRGPLPR